MAIPALLLQNMELFLIESIDHRFDLKGLFRGCGDCIRPIDRVNVSTLRKQLQADTRVVRVTLGMVDLIRTPQ